MSTVSVSDQPFVVEVDETTEAVSVASPGPQGATGPTGPQGPTGPTGPQGPSGVIAVTSPITNSGTSTSADIGIQDGTTAQKGAVQLEDSTASTSTTKAATPNSVKSAYDLAGTKVSSVTGTSPIASSGGTTPAISIQDGTTAQKGAVQLEDSTSSTSTTKAATPNSVKSAYDLANGKPSLSSSNPVALGTAAPGTGTAASKDDHVHPTTGLLLSASASAARPLLTSGAYLSGTGLVLAGITSNYASAPDSAALSITGDIDIRCKAALSDWTPATLTVLVNKFVSPQRSYALSVNTDGTLRFYWSTDGSAFSTADSTVATGITDGATKWVRVTFDVDNGAAGKDAKFYTSDDGSAWTQLGTTVTTAGTTSIYDGTAALEVGSSNAGTTNLVNGTIYRAQVLNGIGGTTAFDADFSTQTADALAFTESSSNAATVTINTTRYSYGIPGVQFSTQATAVESANLTFFQPFILTKASTIDLAIFEVSSGPASSSTMKIGVYAADDNFQASGALVADFGSTTVGTSATGVFTKQITPVSLQAGNYLLAYNMSVGMTIRYFRGGLAFARGTLGTSPFTGQLYLSQTNSAFPTTSPVWQTIGGASTGNQNGILLRWKAA